MSSMDTRGGWRVLVIEDEADLLATYQRLLGRQGYEVITATSRSSGLAAVRAATGKDRLDLVICDLRLPDGDGLDLIQRCRAQGINAPVMILSARRSVDERVRGLEQGGDDYLTNPFALAELLARLRNILRRAAPGYLGP